jgi:peptidyl-prolyl isomerase E (cyclophilin E)
MQTTLVDAQGKGSNPKTTLYVGGLDELVTQDIFRAAFIPFGEILDISVPLDHVTGKHRGFGFIQYESAEDAEAAVDNMNHAELFGRTLKVNYSHPNKIKGGDKGWASQAIWADIDEYQEKQMANQKLLELEEEQRQRQESLALQDGALPENINT